MSALAWKVFQVETIQSSLIGLFELSLNEAIDTIFFKVLTKNMFGNVGHTGFSFGFTIGLLQQKLPLSILLNILAF